MQIKSCKILFSVIIFIITLIPLIAEKNIIDPSQKVYLDNMYILESEFAPGKYITDNMEKQNFIPYITLI